MKPNHFKASHYYLGRYRRLCYLAAALFNAVVFAVMISPFYFPVDSQAFNFVSLATLAIFMTFAHSALQACAIFGAATIFGILSFVFIPEENWLPREKVIQALQTADDTCT
jgi:translation initiation factor 5B